MSLTILEKKASIEAAIATMNPIAKEAAQLLSHRIFENPQLIENPEEMWSELLHACAFSARRGGIADEKEFSEFLDNHSQSVLNVAVSIVLYTIKAHKKKKKWGVIGKVAALATGAAIASFFG